MNKHYNKVMANMRLFDLSLNYPKRLLLSFIVILCLMAIFIGLISGYTFNIIKTEIGRANLTTLTLFQNQFDSKIAEANSIINQLSLDTTVAYSVYSDNLHENIDYTTIYDIYTRIRPIKNDLMTDLFIYYSNSERVISAYNCSLSSDYYFKTYYPDSNLTENQWLSILKKINIYKLTAVGSTNPHIMILQSLPINDLKSANAVIACVVEIESSTAFLEEVEWGNGAIMVFDRNNDLILSLNNNYTFIDPADYDGTARLFTDSYDGKKYIIQNVQSKTTGCKYISVMPVRYFWHIMFKLYVLIAVSLIIFILIGLFLSLILTKYNYRPVHKLVADILHRTNAKTSIKGFNEFDYIWHTLDDALNEKAKQSTILKNAFLIRLLKADYTKENNIEKDLKSYDITFNFEFFMVMLFQIEPCNNLPVEKMISSLLDNLPVQVPQSNIIFKEVKYYVCILNLSSCIITHPRDFTQYLFDVIDKLKKKNVICTVSVGDLHSGYRGISQSYQEAEEAMQYSIILGKEHVLTYDMIPNRNFDYNFNYRNEAYKLVLSYITEGVPSAMDIIRRIKQLCFNNSVCLLDEYKCYIYDMNNMLQSIVSQIRADINLPDMFHCKSMEQYESLFAETLNSLHIFYLKNKSEKSQEEIGKLCAQIVAFIESNYDNINLGVGFIGQHFNFTSSYLSKLFKEHTGLTISNYIINIRIENAKELLAHTDMCINEISEKIGYLSSTVFIRIFRKQEGITPGAYKKLMRS